MSLLSAWIVARLRKKNFKKLQGQDRKSVMSEKLVGGMEGRPGAGQGGEREDMPGLQPPTPTSAAYGKGLPLLGPQAAQGRWEELWRHQVVVGPEVLHPP